MNKLYLRINYYADYAYQIHEIQENIVKSQGLIKIKLEDFKKADIKVNQKVILRYSSNDGYSIEILFNIVEINDDYVILHTFIFNLNNN